MAKKPEVQSNNSPAEVPPLRRPHAEDRVIVVMEDGHKTNGLVMEQHTNPDYLSKTGQVGAWIIVVRLRMGQVFHARRLFPHKSLNGKAPYWCWPEEI